ncbi:MAG: hypothetical protein N4A76_10410 [Firmicutes bacterium]|jgi:hypothetical protein|nr:hypothetical protein [Bacillota bacterium]
MGKVINLSSYSSEANPFRTLMQEVRVQIKELMNIEGEPSPVLKLFELIPEHVLPGFLEELLNFKSEDGIRIAIILSKNYSGEVKKFVERKLKAVPPSKLKEIESKLYVPSRYVLEKCLISRTGLKGKFNLVSVLRDTVKYGHVIKSLYVDVEKNIFKDFDVIYKDGDYNTGIRSIFGDTKFNVCDKEDHACIVNNILRDYKREKENLPSYREVIEYFTYGIGEGSNKCIDQIVIDNLELIDLPSYSVNTFYYSVASGKNMIVEKLFNGNVTVPIIVRKLGASPILKSEIIDEEVNGFNSRIRSNCYVETQNEEEILKYALLFSLKAEDGQWMIDRIEIEYTEVVLPGMVLNEGDKITNIGVYSHDEYDEIMTFLELFVEGIDLSGDDKFIKSINFDYDPRKSDIDYNKNLRDLIIVTENELIITSSDHFDILQELISFNPLRKNIKHIQTVELTVGVIFEYIYSDYDSLQEYLFEDKHTSEESYILYFDFKDMDKLKISSNKRIDIFIINIMNIVNNVLVRSGVKEGTAIKFSKRIGKDIKDHYNMYIKSGLIEILDASSDKNVEIRELELIEKSPLKDKLIINDFYKEILLKVENVLEGFDDIKKYHSKSEILRYNSIIALIEYFDDLIIESYSDIVFNHDMDM